MVARDLSVEYVEALAEVFDLRVKLVHVVLVFEDSIFVGVTHLELVAF